MRARDTPPRALPLVAALMLSEVVANESVAGGSSLGPLLCGCLALGKACHASTRPPTAGHSARLRSSWRTYRSHQGGYTIRYPRRWQVGMLLPMPGALFTSLALPGGGPAIHVYVYPGHTVRRATTCCPTSGENWGPSWAALHRADQREPSYDPDRRTQDVPDLLPCRHRSADLRSRREWASADPASARGSSA
jgi:hypothetical protein